MVSLSFLGIRLEQLLDPGHDRPRLPRPKHAAVEGHRRVDVSVARD